MLNLSAVTERKRVPSFLSSVFLVIKSGKEGGEGLSNLRLEGLSNTYLTLNPNRRNVEKGSEHLGRI